jgi:CelD/BcsL family acetyltransferase involved in cellulose biosynthesis
MTTSNGPIECADLACTVFLNNPPLWALTELPGLYGSAFSVAEYFRIYNGVTDLSLCIHEGPHHVVAFTHSGSSAVILNQLFDIDATSLQHVFGAIFQSLPRLQRIRVNGSRLDPATLPLPTRVLACSEDVVIALPSDYDSYFATLGASARENLRRDARRFAAAYPDHRVLVYERSEIPRTLSHAIAELHRRRMASKGETSLFTPDAEARNLEFSMSYGLCVAYYVGDKIIAGTLGSLIGHDYYGDVQTFNPDFAKYGPGTLCLLQTMRECIDREVRRFHLLWGRDKYKSHLRGEPQALCAFVAYRTATSRLTHVDDVLREWLWRSRQRPWMRRARTARARLARLLTGSSTK